MSVHLWFQVSACRGPEEDHRAPTQVQYLPQQLQSVLEQTQNF